MTRTREAGRPPMASRVSLKLSSTNRTPPVAEPETAAIAATATKAKI